MKAVISILLILAAAFGALHYKRTGDAAATERDDALAKVAHLEEQHDKLTADLKARDKELAEALARVVTLEEAAKTESGDRSPISGDPKPAMADRGAVGGGASTPVPGEDPLRAQREAWARQIAERIAVLEAEQTRGRNARANAVANPPTFAEQGDRVDAFGRVIGKKGVRVSEADRAKAMAAHQARITAMDARLAEIAAELAGLRAEAGISDR